MRRLLSLTMLALALTACTPDAVQEVFDSLHGPSRVQAIFEADVNDQPSIPDALAQTAAVVQRRLELAGIRADVAPFSGETPVIVITAPDGDLDAVITLATRPGQLEFVDLRGAPAALLAVPDDALLSTSAHPNAGGQVDPQTGAPYPTVIDAIQVIEAAAEESPYVSEWQVQITFSPEHGAALADYTAASIGTPLGIAVDGRLLTAPVIQTAIGAEVVISGGMGEAEARELAAVVGGGALPFALTLAEVR